MAAKEAPSSAAMARWKGYESILEGENTVREREEAWPRGCIKIRDKRAEVQTAVQSVSGNLLRGKRALINNSVGRKILSLAPWIILSFSF